MYLRTLRIATTHKNSRHLILSAYQDSISITHRHILASLNTMVRSEASLAGRDAISILDAGCGDGKLIYFLNRYLPLFNPGKEFLMFGFDVDDHGVQQPDYVARTYAFLQEHAPGVDWTQRIKVIKSNEDWPFRDGAFDVVISNQVLEHVWDHDRFFSENARVLGDPGFSMHLFPVKEVLVDGHIFLPNVHKLRSWDAIYRKVKFYSSLGFGRYRWEKKDFNHDVRYFSRIWADKIYHYCNYQSYADISKAVKRNKLTLTTRFTFSYYWRKLKEVMGFRPDFIYRKYVSSGKAFYLLKHISGISLVFYKNEYAKY